MADNYTPEALALGNTRLRVLAATLDFQQEAEDGLHRHFRGYGWTFMQVDCGSAGCAIGLAKRVWPQANLWYDATEPTNSPVLRAFFALSQAEEGRVFWDCKAAYESEMEVQPKHVAKEIRALVAEREGKADGR